MIYLWLRARCGNQLFQYAVARKLQGMMPRQETLIINEHNPNLHWGPGTNALPQFAIAPATFVDDEAIPIRRYGTPLQQGANALYNRLVDSLNPNMVREEVFRRESFYQPLVNAAGVYRLNHSYAKLGKSNAKNLFLDGSFEDGRLFAEMRDQLRQELRPAAKSPAKNDELYRLMAQTQSVCVSIRRGDFWNSKNAQNFGICTDEYFAKALEIIRQKVPGATLFLFSDDMDWVRENCHFDFPCYYEDGTDTLAEKLNLMRSCKHFVLSNSTFSWWAQFLADAEEPVIVSPSIWTRRAYKSPLIDPAWNFVEVT